MAIGIAVYESWGDLSGKKSTYAELVQWIGRYSRYSVVWCCSYLSVRLRLYEGTTPDYVPYASLIEHYFATQTANRLKLGYLARDTQRLLFHRRQLLLIAKIALSECSLSGLDASVPANGFGIALLLANDHLHFDTIPSSPPEHGYERTHYAAFITEFLATQEFSSSLRPNLVIRAHRMFIELPQLLRAHPDFISIDSALSASTGLTYQEIFAITVGLVSRYVTLTDEELSKNGFAILSQASYLSTLKIPAGSVLRYLDLVSLWLWNPFKGKSGRSEGRADLTLFRRSPLTARWFYVGENTQRLGYLPLDLELWWQKVYSAPFWAIYDQFPEKFGRFWGAVFELYMHDLLEGPHSVAGRKYIRNPRDPQKPNEEICDAAIVEGDSLLLIEFKAVLIRADKKYSGNIRLLSDHLRHKLVEDIKTGKPKGVFQLAEAIKRLFGSYSQTPDWVDLPSIKKCYLLLVTLDEIGDTFSMSPFLETFLEEKLTRSAYPSVTIEPIFSVSVATIERLAPSMQKTSLVKFLARWRQHNPLLSMPLSAIELEDLVVPADLGTEREWERVMTVAKEELFDAATLAHGTIRPEMLKHK